MQSKTMISNLTSLTMYNIFFILISSILFLLPWLVITNCFNCLFNCLLLIVAYLIIFSLKFECSTLNRYKLDYSNSWNSFYCFLSNYLHIDLNTVFNSLSKIYSKTGELSSPRCEHDQIINIDVLVGVLRQKTDS